MHLKMRIVYQLPVLVDRPCQLEKVKYLVVILGYLTSKVKTEPI